MKNNDKILNQIRKQAQVLRQAQMESDRKYWADRTARIAAGKPVTYQLGR